MELSTEFLAYHPYLTFSDPSNECFIKPDGQQWNCNDIDIEDISGLFSIGQQAYKTFPIDVKDNFYTVLHNFDRFVNELRDLFSTLEKDGHFRAVIEHHEEMTVNWDIVEASSILYIAWDYVSRDISVLRDDPKLLAVAFTESFSMLALIKIDNALTAIEQHRFGAIASALEAANALSDVIAIESDTKKYQNARREIARRAAMARISNDPRQQEKKFIFECWEKWQASPAMYKSKAAFARDMLTKVDNLTSQKKIEDWCRAWQAENGT